MKNVKPVQKIETGLYELTTDEVSCVSGGGAMQGAAAIGAAAGIGGAMWGGTWGAVAVGAAFAAAPLAVFGMAALVAYGSYQMFRSIDAQK